MNTNKSTEKTRFQCDWTVRFDPNDENLSVSTLLVPAYLVPVLKEKLAENRCTLPTYLRRLLRGFRRLTLDKSLPESYKCNCQYQEEGLRLKRVNFRPDHESWLELGIIARAHGVSRCFLFTLLLILDSMHVEEAVMSVWKGDPTTDQERWDLLYPNYIEFSERLYPFGWRYERGLWTEPIPKEKLPIYL